MLKRFTPRALAQYLTEHYDGDGSKLWGDGADAATVKRRAKDLPGFGASKPQHAVLTDA